MDAAIAILEGLNEVPVVERGPIRPPVPQESSPVGKYAVMALLAFAAGYVVSNRMAKRSSARLDYF